MLLYRCDEGQHGLKEDSEIQHAALKSPAALRKALIRQRHSKVAGDGLLFDRTLLGSTHTQAQALLLPAPAAEDGQAILVVHLLHTYHLRDKIAWYLS